NNGKELSFSDASYVLFDSSVLGEDKTEVIEKDVEVAVKKDFDIKDSRDKVANDDKSVSYQEAAPAQEIAQIITPPTKIEPIIDPTPETESETTLEPLLDLKPEAEETPAVPTITIDDISVHENTQEAHITISLSMPTTNTVMVDYATVGNTATNGVDNTDTKGVLIFNPGEISKTITIPIFDDGVYENLEILNVDLSNPINATIIDSQGIISIDDDKPILSIGDVIVKEGLGATFAVTVGEAKNPYKVTFNTSTNGSADVNDITTPLIVKSGDIIISQNEDGSYTVPAGVKALSVTVPTVDDLISEGLETFELNGKTEFMDSTTFGVGTIKDDQGIYPVDEDIKATIDVSDAATVKEANGNYLVYDVKLSNKVSEAVSATIVDTQTGTATSGSDYNSTLQYSTDGTTWNDITGDLTLPSDASALKVRVAVIDDAITESAESVIIKATTTSSQITNGSAGDTGSGTITDNDSSSNNAPTATNDTNSVNEDATLTINELNGVIKKATADSDVDNDNLTVTAIRTGTEGGSGTAGIVGNALSGSYGTLTLASDGSYTYVADDANTVAKDATVTDTFTYTISDGNGGTDSAELAITITGTNDAPIIDLDASDDHDTTNTKNYQTSYTENGTGVSIADADSSITDVDDTNIESATIVLTNAKAGDALDTSAVSGLTVNTDTSVSGEITVTLSGTKTLAEYESAIEAIKFETSNTSDTTDRVVTIKVNDGTTDSNTATTTIIQPLELIAFTCASSNSSGTTYDVANQQLSFTNSTNFVGNGKSNGDIVKYTNVITVGGQAIDAVITTSLSGMSITTYDSTSTPTDQNSFFQPLMQGLGKATFTIDFYKGDTYTGVGTGTRATLKNVTVNSYDLDSSGSTDRQFQEFKDFTSYKLAATNDPDKSGGPDYINTIVQGDKAVRFEAKNSTNYTGNYDSLGAENYRVQVYYDEIQSFELSTGVANKSATAYFSLDFSIGPAWQNSTVIEANPAITCTTDSVTAQSDDANFTYQKIGDGTNGNVVDNGNGTLTYTPSSDFSGTDVFDYQRTDSTTDEKLTLKASVVVSSKHAYVDSSTDIDAGDGLDTIILSDGANIDFDSIANIDNFESINLSKNGNHTLSNITVQDIIDITDANNDLIIFGDSGDSVSLKNESGKTWTKDANQVTENGHTFDIYTNVQDNNISVKVEDQINDSII
ncbi:MAG: cadherin-like domain-containing protein, partial [Campylobacterales bacterium]|nr:cadherin-like domain-containing protein [Campylobacterales bacterium]